jgi:RNA polymerase sigma-70 factor (ECF subfamily)
VFRRESGRCTATLIRVLGDVDLAEDAVAEAFEVALTRWPRDGVPDNPGAWITTTARRRALDRLRRESTRHDRHVAAHRTFGTDGSTGADPSTVGRLVEELGGEQVEVVADDQLRLMFLCCHPVLAPDSQVALTLRLLGGLQTPEIARAFLVPEATMAQRIVRAKRKLRDNHARYRIPVEAELPDRLPPVLAAISLIFTEGHRATDGSGLVRVELSNEAIRLGRVLADLMPDEPEAAGLLALMLLTDARRSARLDATGALVPLAGQDRDRWDQDRIAEGLDRLAPWSQAGGSRSVPDPGRAGCGCTREPPPSPTPTGRGSSSCTTSCWQRRSDPVVAVNRAVALGELDGPAPALLALDGIDDHERQQLDSYQPWHAARADLLARAGRPAEAVEAYDRAIALTASDAERRFLTARRQACRAGQTPP